MNNSGSSKRKLESTTISSSNAGMNIQIRNGAAMGNSGSNVGNGHVQAPSNNTNYYGRSSTQSSTSGTASDYSAGPAQQALTATHGSNYQGTNYQGTNYQGTIYQGTNYQQTNYLSPAEGSYCSNICVGGNALFVNHNYGTIHMNSASFDKTFVNFNYGTITMNCGYPSSRSTYTNASLNSSVAASQIGYAETAGHTRAATFGNRHAVTTVNTNGANTSNTYVSTEPLQKRAKTKITSTASQTNLSGRKKAAVLLVDDDECIICYETYKKIEDNMASLPCGHYYHKNCLDKWLVVENTCPVCRKNALTGESV